MKTFFPFLFIFCLLAAACSKQDGGGTAATKPQAPPPALPPARPEVLVKDAGDQKITLTLKPGMNQTVAIAAPPAQPAKPEAPADVHVADSVAASLSAKPNYIGQNATIQTPAIRAAARTQAVAQMLRVRKQAAPPTSGK